VPYIDFRKVKDAVSIERAAKLLNIEAKQSGSTLRAQCPACQTEDERSLAISPQKNAYYCHTAEVGGDCISLTAHVLGLSMKDAAEWLHDTLPHPRQEVTAPQEPRREPTRPSQPAAAPREFDAEAYAQKLQYNEDVAALGLSEADAARLGIGYVATGFHRGSIVFALRDSSGVIAGFAGYKDGALKFPKLSPQNVVKLRRA
jgi:DNA primase